MSEHRATVQWRHTGGVFDYESFSRNHTWTFPNGIAVEASAAPAFRGDDARIDPEEGFVAAVSSCHMLTFLAIAAKKRLVVETYEDDAVGFLEKNDAGKLAVTRVDLHPRVRFGGETGPTGEALAKLHDLAHRDCFIANSVRTEIRVVAEAGR